MIIKFACNYKIQLARGYVLSVCIGVCKRQGEQQRVNRAHADQRKPKCVSLWETGDRDPPTGEAQQSALLCIQGGGEELVCIYIYIYIPDSYIRICIFIIVSFANRRNFSLMPHDSLTEKHERVTRAWHVVFIYNISIFFRFVVIFEERMDGWMERGCIFFFTIRKTLLRFYWPYFRRETSNGTWPGSFHAQDIRTLRRSKHPLETSHDPECPPFLGLSTPALKPPWKPLVTVETVEERVESVLIWEKLENVSILTRGNIVLSESKFEFLEENVWKF